MDWRFQFGDPPRTEEHGRTMRLIQIGHIDLRFFPWPSDSYNAIKFILASWWCVSWPQGCVTHWPVVPDKWQEVLVNGSPNSLCAKCWWQRTSPAFCSMFPFSIGKILSFSLYPGIWLQHFICSVAMRSNWPSAPQAPTFSAEYNLVKAIINHPPVITINGWYIYHSNIWAVYDYYSLYQLCSLVFNTDLWWYFNHITLW